MGCLDSGQQLPIIKVKVKVKFSFNLMYCSRAMLVGLLAVKVVVAVVATVAVVSDRWSLFQVGGSVAFLMILFSFQFMRLLLGLDQLVELHLL